MQLKILFLPLPNYVISPAPVTNRLTSVSLPWKNQPAQLRGKSEGSEEQMGEENTWEGVGGII